MTLHPDALNALVYGDHGAPFEILGPHADGDQAVIVRAFRPNAKSLSVIVAGQPPQPMERVHEFGLFETRLSKPLKDFSYCLRELTYEDVEHEFYDPYAFPPLMTEFDIYLFTQGRHLQIYEKMGAQIREVNGVKGVNFAVWAPNAKRVALVGHFNNWDNRIHPMQLVHSGGIWEIFVPGVTLGSTYKYDIKSHHRGYQNQKTDPYGFQFEMRPKTASVVADIHSYEWGDDEWMQKRTTIDPLTAPLSIYEMHVGSWRRNWDGNRWLTYRELADQLIPYVKEMGYTHIELMPVTEYPYDGSWGYQVTGYFAPTSRYGTPDEFSYFIDQCHQNGIGVLLDWVPAHFPKDGHALSYFDGTHLYSHEDPRQGEHPDWGTYIFNYGRNEVANFLLASALFWLKHYHIDGLRVDAVSSMLYLSFSRKHGEWLPNKYGGSENLEAIAFIKELNEMVHAQCPGVMMMAEEATSWPMVSRPTYIGGLGFTFKWNMGWMHDTLFYMKKDPLFRRWEHNKMTFSIMYAFNENFILALSHDEVVHLKGSLMTKMAGDWWQKFASLRLLYTYQYTHPGKKLNFMGHEIAQWSEWSEERALDWNLLELPTHQKFQKWIQHVNKFYMEQPALWEQDFTHEGFQWIEADDAEQSVFSYIRFAKDRTDYLVIVANFTPVVRYDYRVGVPDQGIYDEVLNSDSGDFGGSNVGNSGQVSTEDFAWQRQPYSVRLTLPPLGAVVLKFRRPAPTEAETQQALVEVPKAADPAQVVESQPSVTMDPDTGEIAVDYKGTQPIEETAIAPLPVPKPRPSRKKADTAQTTNPVEASVPAKKPRSSKKETNAALVQTADQTSESTKKPRGSKKKEAATDEGTGGADSAEKPAKKPRTNKAATPPDTNL
jgi:1,4-alpha-glucan branching enzyme